MKISTKEYLITIYNEYSNKKSSCIKYYYQYNGVNVNLYFDAFEPESTNFSMVLNYDNLYYFKTMNILNDNLNSEFLEDIPHQILNKILVENSLNDFYDTMEKKMLDSTPYRTTYKDKLFSNTQKYNRNKDELPFWYCVRQVRISDKTLERLLVSTEISRDVLQKIQARGFTLIRTADYKKRKKLTVILNELTVKLN